MKLILKDYLLSLKEREQLDVLVQNLLSQMGLNVFLIPRRGVKEHGVDIAAYGCWPGEIEEKVFLFAVKSGNITRSNWSGSPQSLRESLQEIVDSYIPHFILPEHKDKKIVICPCFGGSIDKTIFSSYTGFISNLTDAHKNKLEIKTINGDELANLVLDYLCNERLMPSYTQKEFIKSLAYVSDADIVYKHFSTLLSKLFSDTTPEGLKLVLEKLRLLHLSLGILFSNAKDSKCVLGVSKCSELALLISWNYIRKLLASDRKNTKLLEAFTQLCMLHVLILRDLLDELYPFSGHPFALSCSVSDSQMPLNYGCISIRLIELLGLISSLGIWVLWIKDLFQGAGEEEEIKPLNEFINRINEFTFNVIENNPICFTPIQDEQCSDLLIMFDFWILTNKNSYLSHFVAQWTEFTGFSLVRRLYYTSNTRGLKEFLQLEYKRRKEFTDEDFKKSTNSLATIAYISLLARLLKLQDVSAKIDEIFEKLLQHTSLQIYFFDEATEENLYTNQGLHGLVLSGISMLSKDEELIESIERENDSQIKIMESLSCYHQGFWPLVYASCRHYKLPLPGSLLYKHVTEMPSEESTNES